MRGDEIRAMNPNEIARRLDEVHQEQVNLRFQYATGQLKNTARLAEVRHEIARLRTVLREVELAAAKGER